jgi:hypothetical protein
MGAGIQECDVTFTKDGELVCRHDECDLHTTTNILVTNLASKCTQPFTPAVLLITPPEAFAQNLSAVKRAAAAAGRADSKWQTVLLTTGCVLRPGETIRSQRLVDRVGPFAIVSPHALWQESSVIKGAPAELQDLGRRYREEYVERTGTPPDRAYLTVHEGHLVYLKPGEEKYLDENVMNAITLTGTADEIIARLKALEKVGATQVAIQVVNDGPAMIEEFSENVIARYST